MYFTTVEITGSVDPDGFESDRFGSAKMSVGDVERVNLVLNEETGEPLVRCSRCGEGLDSDDRRTSLEEGETVCSNGDEDDASHQPEDVPLAWVNSADIALDEADDSVTVSISAGDPRGGFTMTIHRLDDGRLIMHVPHEGMSSPHMQLKPIGDGTYELS